MKPMIRRTIITVLVLALALIAFVIFFKKSNDQSVSYRTEKVKRGDLMVTISATGTVEPEEVIDVGAQVAGRILEFGKDKNNKTIDYGSVIGEGTVLAQIDDSLYAADAAQAAAQVQQSRASLERAKADIEQIKAKLYQAKRDWERAQKLGPSEALAETAYDAYKSGYETAVANLAVSRATIEQAVAAVAQSEAAFKRAQQNLGYCTIKSPVKGVIIDRRVNIGQTVVASLNAPSLFLIAKDLKRMQVWVAVNEADIGKIHSGQKVSFTVDAFPGELFHGEVGKVRLNASMSQNVVTYTVEIITDNSNGRLLPYLTANVQFELDRLNNVLTVPNAALRWTPTSEQVDPKYRDLLLKSAGDEENLKKDKRSGNNKEQKHPNGKKKGTVWIIRSGNLPEPLQLTVGTSDGMLTQVEGDGLKEGLGVILGQQVQTNSDTEDTSNPFVPNMGRGRH
ncbi:efflux RND transporter periplasmic adaptor subunit [Desulfobacterium sp. N47]|uniref:efflux RND transporter periplasmic adaptor subunit n=1 Tax=Desulfobacterium sp. N47 TaxID=3115210 RepID=UPI003CC1F220